MNSINWVIQLLKYEELSTLINQINWKSASEIFASYLLRNLFLVKWQAGSLQQPFEIELLHKYFQGFY